MNIHIGQREFTVDMTMDEFKEFIAGRSRDLFDETGIILIPIEIEGGTMYAMHMAPSHLRSDYDAAKIYFTSRYN